MPQTESAMGTAVAPQPLAPRPGVAALELERVTCSFVPRTPGAQRYTAIEDASLAVRDGEFVALVGPTGCGKSTLLNVAAGLLSPIAGAVSVFGEPLNGVNRHAGYLFQPDSLFPWRNALDNVATGLEFRGMPRAAAYELARPWLSRVGLGAHAQKYPHELSGGMRKRVALAQTWVLEPRVLLMDEPFSALDVQTRQLMENELLAMWAERRASVLFVTHDLEEAIALADEVVVLSAGPASRVVAKQAVTLERPRDLMELRTTPAFVDLYRAIWTVLRKEVIRSQRAAEPKHG